MNYLTEIYSSDLFKPLRYLSHEFKFNFVELFAGIGGFRIALEELGGRCLGYSEINQECIKVYQRNFISYVNANEVNLGDITHLDKLPFDNIDLIVGGVPCQPWSVAGKLKGFEDRRGQLWFDALRIINNNRPKAFIWENVRGLVGPTNQANFNYLLAEFGSLGYKLESAVLNAYDFGLPQSRDRVFMVGIREDLATTTTEFNFPRGLNVKSKLSDVIEGVDKNPVIKHKLAPAILFGEKIPLARNRFQKLDELNDFFIFCDTRDGHTTIHSWDIIKTSDREKLICQTILKNRRKKQYGLKDGNPLSWNHLSELIPDLEIKELNELINKKILRLVEDQGYEFVNSKNSSGINGIYRIFLPHSEMIPTLTATITKDFIATISIEADNPTDYKKLFLKEIYQKGKFKPISAKDASRLQGFPDWFMLHDNQLIAKSQLGNAVPVPVVYRESWVENLVLLGRL